MKTNIRFTFLIVKLIPFVLLVKKDDMLDSLDDKKRSYDNSTNGINFTSIGNEVWSIYNDKYFEIWTFFS